MKDISVKEYKKLISKARTYALRHSYMDMDYGIFELMVKFHLQQQVPKDPSADDKIPTTKQEMLDAIQNFVGMFDTPVVRLKYHNSMTQGAIDIGKEILKKNGIVLYGK